MSKRTVPIDKVPFEQLLAEDIRKELEEEYLNLKKKKPLARKRNVFLFRPGIKGLCRWL